MSIKIDKLITGPVDCNTNFVYEEGKKDCFIVDPADFELINRHLEKQGLNVTDILLTHGHYDHILAVAELKSRHNARVYIHEADEDCLYKNKVNLSIFCGADVEPSKADVQLKDGDKFVAAGIEIETLHTPGHTMGCACYILPKHKIMFSGDTLFRLSVGRTDLYGASNEQLEDSLLNKLYALEGDFRVMPGHERETTLDFERKNNPYTKHLK
ncbi:MAG: MBL fold metallo-hydrolase [Clostridiales bacterium]|nr:MBL fold metallo-hydrolase [Clostridiales bacterium]